MEKMMQVNKTYCVTLPFGKKPNVFKVVRATGTNTVWVEIISGPRPYKGATHCNIFNYSTVVEI